MGSKLGWARKFLLWAVVIPGSITVVAVGALLAILNNWWDWAQADEGTKALTAWVSIFGFAVTATIFVFIWKTRHSSNAVFDVKKAFWHDVMPRSWWWIPFTLGSIWVSSTGFITGLEWWHGFSVALVGFCCSFLDAIPRHRIPSATGVPGLHHPLQSSTHLGPGA